MSEPHMTGTLTRFEMKEKLIKLFDLKFIESRKWNDIWYSDTHVFIFNRTTKECRIKPR